MAKSLFKSHLFFSGETLLSFRITRKPEASHCSMLYLWLRGMLLEDRSHEPFLVPAGLITVVSIQITEKTCWLIAYLEVFSGSLGCVGCISVYGSVYVLTAWIHWRAQHVLSLPILKTLQSSIPFPWHGYQVLWQDVPSSSGILCKMASSLGVDFPS